MYSFERKASWIDTITMLMSMPHVLKSSVTTFVGNFYFAIENSLFSFTHLTLFACFAWCQEPFMIAYVRHPDRFLAIRGFVGCKKKMMYMINLWIFIVHKNEYKHLVNYCFHPFIRSSFKRWWKKEYIIGIIPKGCISTWLLTGGKEMGAGITFSYPEGQ